MSKHYRWRDIVISNLRVSGSNDTLHSKVLRAIPPLLFLSLFLLAVNTIATSEGSKELDLSETPVNRIVICNDIDEDSIGIADGQVKLIAAEASDCLTPISNSIDGIPNVFFSSIKICHV